MKQIIVVNLKTYAEASGKKAVEIARIAEEVSSETGKQIAIAPPMPDLSAVSAAVSIPVFSEHVDNVPVGSTTGFVPPESAKAAGATGTLINHSEHRLVMADIEALVVRCRTIGMTTVLCTNNISVSRACAALDPDFIAIEPPELIGGDISVTDANPGIVSDAVAVIKEISPKIGILTGAGVKNGRDVAKAIELGTDGVLLASGVAKAKDSKSVLMDLASGLP